MVSKTFVEDERRRTALGRLGRDRSLALGTGWRALVFRREESNCPALNPIVSPSVRRRTVSCASTKNALGTPGYPDSPTAAGADRSAIAATVLHRNGRRCPWQRTQSESPKQCTTRSI